MSVLPSDYDRDPQRFLSNANRAAGENFTLEYLLKHDGLACYLTSSALSCRAV